MNPDEPKREMLLRHLDGRASAEERAQVNAWLRSDPAARTFFRELAEHAVTVADLEREALGRDEVMHGRATSGLDAGRIAALPGRLRSTFAGRALLAIAASVIVVLGISLYLQHSDAEALIAKVSGISGAVQWTGNGGQVVRDFHIGTELAGGTIEGLTPNSWCELEFRDGSKVSFSGNSVLTVSDHGQKELHLKEGDISANVQPQPTGRPMLIYTRSAVLEVVGTQFEVEAALAATTLNVSKGEVRVKRLSDGATVNVLARQRVIAAADRELLPVPIPASVTRWKSQLQLGPRDTKGNWSPKTGELDAAISTVPYTTREGKTIYTVGFGLSSGDRPPVTLEPGSRLRVRGRVASSYRIFFGVTVRRANSEFAGRFQTIRPAVEFATGQPFEVVLDLRDFHLDPSLAAMKSRLPGDPFHLVVESVWCHTLDKPAGLEITEAELIPPNDGEAK